MTEQWGVQYYGDWLDDGRGEWVDDDRGNGEPIRFDSEAEAYLWMDARYGDPHRKRLAEWQKGEDAHAEKVAAVEAMKATLMEQGLDASLIPLPERRYAGRKPTFDYRVVRGDMMDVDLSKWRKVEE